MELCQKQYLYSSSLPLTQSVQFKVVCEMQFYIFVILRSSFLYSHCGCSYVRGPHNQQEIWRECVKVEDDCELFGAKAQYVTLEFVISSTNSSLLCPQSKSKVMGSSHNKCGASFSCVDVSNILVEINHLSLLSNPYKCAPSLPL